MTNLTFEQAYTRLKEIHDMLQKEEIVDIEKIVSLQKESKELYTFLDNIMKKNQDSEDMDNYDDE